MSRRTRLAAIMASRPWPQYMWAALFRLDPIVISRYRRGLKPIRADHLEMICEALGCEPKEVVGWDDDEAWDDPYEIRLRKLAARDPDVAFEALLEEG